MDGGVVVRQVINHTYRAIHKKAFFQKGMQEPRKKEFVQMFLGRHFLSPISIGFYPPCGSKHHCKFVLGTCPAVPPAIPLDSSWQQVHTAHLLYLKKAGTNFFALTCALPCGTGLRGARAGGCPAGGQAASMVCRCAPRSAGSAGSRRGTLRTHSSGLTGKKTEGRVPRPRRAG